MKHNLIKYQFKGGSEAEWHADIAGFISDLDNDPELRGKISYRCLKSKKGPDYFHLAVAVDDQAAGILQSREFFKRYNAKTKLVSGGTVEVLPLELIGETAIVH